MKFFHDKKNDCTQCDVKFSNHEDLVKHVRHEHHRTIVKCQYCGKEFLHEKDRLRVISKKLFKSVLSCDYEDTAIIDTLTNEPL